MNYTAIDTGTDIMKVISFVILMISLHADFGDEDPKRTSKRKRCISLVALGLYVLSIIIHIAANL